MSTLKFPVDLILQRHFLTSCRRRGESGTPVMSENKLDARFRGNDNRNNYLIQFR